MMIESALEMDVQALMYHIECSIDMDHYSNDDNFLYYQNKESSICLVSHVDTVRKESLFPLKVEKVGNVIKAKDSILGADDRAGVWAMLEIAGLCKRRKIEMPNMIFTNYEESGGKGMSQLCHASKKYFKHINLGIALDRKGCNEYVTYNHLPKAVSKYVESFGWIRDHGTFSDIEYFADEYLIPCINVSIGYHHAHTTNERLHLDELKFCINRVMEMIENPIGKRHSINRDISVYEQYDYGYYGYGSKHKKGGKGYKVNDKRGNYERIGCEGDLCGACGEEYGSMWMQDAGESWIWVCESCNTYYGDNTKRHEEALPYGYSEYTWS